MYLYAKFHKKNTKHTKMKKAFTLAAAMIMAVATANAQEIIKSKSVPAVVLSQFTADAGAKNAKKAIWYQSGDYYTAVIDDKNTRYNSDGNLIWTSTKIEKADINAEVLNAYNTKYESNYPYQWAEDVVLDSGAKYTFIIGRKDGHNYFFKYNDKNLMVEKKATSK